MVRTQIYITEEQHRELKRIYAETGQRITESIRQAVAAYLAGREEMLKVQKDKTL
jgi:hypothetical protein